MAGHCVITGAADGIGKALAARFAADSWQVTGIDIDAQKAEETTRELGESGKHLSFIIANLSDANGRDYILESLNEKPPVDVLIHNAGINHVSVFGKSDLDTQKAILRVNLHAPIHLTARLLEMDGLAEESTLVFVSSLSHFVGYPGASVYAASKDGLASFAKSLRVALRAKGVHVLTVFPGPTRTGHARRHSPDKQREDRRMPPEILAARIYRAVMKKKGILIPGAGNKIFAFTGRFIPALTEKVMKKAILDKIQEQE